MLHISRGTLITVIGLVLLAVVFAAPNLIPRERMAGWPAVIADSRIDLGLDLRGGSYLLLEVDADVVVAERLEAIEDEVRTQFRGARIQYVGLRVEDGTVRFRLRDPAQVPQARELMDEIAQSSTQSFLGGVVEPDLDVILTETGEGTLTLTETAINERIGQAVDQSVEIVRRRIDETGTREPLVQRQGLDRVLVQLPGIDDPERIKALIGRTAKLTFQMVDTGVNPRTVEASGRLPVGTELMYGDDLDGDGVQDPYVIRRRVQVSGDMLTDAQPVLDRGQWVVTFSLDTIGARRFGDVTRENVGRPFAIILDNEVISAPRINEPITGGHGQISGSFSPQDAADLALLLRAGALPAPLNVLEERTVGPSLGADSVAAGEAAGLVAIVAVLLFMVLAYGVFGIAAASALAMNMVMIAAALSILPATLTLPGIAGIVLTIGMAVDANVLVFERIREETASGKTPFAAVDTGYQRALSSILDANVTTLIAAFLLYAFGSGPVRGFAVTLAVGIVTSVFTAVFLTRVLVVTYLRRRRPQVLAV